MVREIPEPLMNRPDELEPLIPHLEDTFLNFSHVCQ